MKIISAFDTNPPWSAEVTMALFKKTGQMTMGEVGRFLSGKLESEFNLNQIETMSYLDRLKQNLENDIQHHESKIKDLNVNLGKLDEMEYLTNDRLYQFMQSFEIIKVGDVYAITVPENYLISTDQETILTKYVQDINKRDGYSTNPSVEVIRTRIK